MPRLLLIEDNEHILRIYSDRFRFEGFEVITAVDGELGIQRARDSQPDVILLDVMLPKKSGFDVLQELHDDPVLNKIPVCVLSNRSWPDDINRLLTLGARQFFSKGSATPQHIVIIQRLKSTAQAGSCRILAITNLAAGLINADQVISEAQLQTELRPTVLRLLGVEELPPAAVS